IVSSKALCGISLPTTNTNSCWPASYATWPHGSRRGGAVPDVPNPRRTSRLHEHRHDQRLGNPSRLTRCKFLSERWGSNPELHRKKPGWPKLRGSRGGSNARLRCLHSQEDSPPLLPTEVL